MKGWGYHKDVLIGGSSDDAKAVVGWVAALFATGEVRLMTGSRFILLCDPGAADDLSRCGIGEGAAPRGYVREVLGSRTGRIGMAA